MAHEVIMPMLGMAQDTGKLLSWCKSAGEAVAVGDVLFEVETDKSVSEVEAQADGFLAGVSAEEGADIPVGQVIAMITADPDEAIAPGPEISRPVAETPSDPQPQVQESPVAAPPLQTGGDRILASPKARRLAKEAGLTLSQFSEAGVPQPIRAADVERLATQPIAQAAPHAGAKLHIAAQVPAVGCNALIIKMNDDAGVQLSLANLAVAFAAVALRVVSDAQNLTLTLKQHGNPSVTFHDPDKMRLSQMTGEEGDAPADLELIDLGETYLTTTAIDAGATPTLTIALTGGNIHLSLSYSSSNLTTDQAIALMSDLSARMAEPLLALV